jgi:hypothetical protein
MPTRKIAQAEWERHSALLENLFIHQKMTLKEVKAYMEEKHDFSARYASSC